MAGWPDGWQAAVRPGATATVRPVPGPLPRTRWHGPARTADLRGQARRAGLADPQGRRDQTRRLAGPVRRCCAVCEIRGRLDGPGAILAKDSPALRVAASPAPGTHLR